MVVLVVVGALFLPSTAPRLPTADLAAWITGPSSHGGTVAVPASLWGDLVRDGVPAERLVREGAGAPADWTVGAGEPPPGATAVARFGPEPVLTVSGHAPVP
jgi:putative peptide zinc metalloprotease protein